MQQDSASFWSDIKKYEEQLQQDPDSYLFARLAEVYLKVNLIDDALYTARRGVEKYPSYVAGQKALALACHAKGLQWECRQALETVAAATPEDSQAQLMLARLLVSNGKNDDARKALATILVFHPEDQESREELQALEQAMLPPVEETPEVPSGAGPVEPAADAIGEEEEIIDLLESDIVEEFEPGEEMHPSQAAGRPDPLSTGTLAELYVQQGFTGKALDIYRTLFAEDPSNSAVQTRIAELEAREAASTALPAMPDETVAVSDAVFQETAAFPQSIPSHGSADDVVATLESWLENIRRIKACR